jgi:hypothetical protein
MVMSDALPSVDFSEAKAHLSDVMTAVVHGRQPRLVQRHRGKEAMLLMRADDVARALAAFRFQPQVVYSEGEVTVALERFGILGFGATLEEALEDTVAELRAYAQRFFERPAFYAETDRADHWPWLLRFALTPQDGQAALLVEDSRVVAPADVPAVDARVPLPA